MGMICCSTDEVITLSKTGKKINKDGSEDWWWEDVEKLKKEIKAEIERTKKESGQKMAFVSSVNIMNLYKISYKIFYQKKHKKGWNEDCLDLNFLNNMKEK